ncbi:MAG: aminoglycoside phosphotransferase family protein [Chloroflexi bacterium]|nr:aminoglycoside phosphotransferase family protein [Chloroflexota bacterium]MDA1147207.1 aminoglycoside phosphotransferase family protein [Chloroflexota bacterium]
MKARLSPRIAQHLAEALHGARVEEARSVGEGWNVTAWRVPAADGDWLVRVPKLEGATPEIERQTCLYRTLEAAGLPVPKSARLLTDSNGTVLAGLYRFGDGELATRSMNRGRRRRRLAQDLAAFLDALHATPLSQARACGIEARDKWGRYEQWMHRHDALFGPRTRAYLANLRQQWATAIGDGPVRHTLVHADLAPEHLVIEDGGRLVSVLDFGGPQITDPAIDFANLATHYGWPFTNLVLADSPAQDDEQLRLRAELYEQLHPLHAVDARVTRGDPELLGSGLRKLARRASRRAGGD